MPLKEQVRGVQVRPEAAGRGRSPEELTHEHCQGKKRSLIFPTIEGEETEVEPARQLCHWTCESRLPWDSQPFVYRPPRSTSQASLLTIHTAEMSSRSK